MIYDSAKWRVGLIQRQDLSFIIYLQRPEENKFVVQRGRFVNWNFKTTQQLIERIKGN